MPARVADAVRRVDAALAALAARVDLLLDVTPVDAEEAWARSVAARHHDDLVLHHRPIGTDVAGVRHELGHVPLDEVDDPTLHHLFAEHAARLAGELRLIEARGTHAFLERSVDLWGTADDRLLDLALGLLRRLPVPPPTTATVTPAAFAARARDELARYRRQDRGLQASVEVRDDVPSLMVVQRRVLVGTDSWIPSHRVEALVHHEVGTHLLTAATGGRQPLSLLEHGLAGHDETQEALGVLAEHLVGGLDADRLRTLAARAVAVRRLTDGARFPDLFAELHHEHGFGERAAWTIAMRVVRGGGLTKDVIYLRGVDALVDHLADGGRLDPLLVGKLHLRHVDSVEHLLATGVLVPAHLRPGWLDGDGAQARLAALRAGRAPLAVWPA